MDGPPGLAGSRWGTRPGGPLPGPAGTPSSHFRLGPVRAHGAVHALAEAIPRRPGPARPARRGRGPRRVPAQGPAGARGHAPAAGRAGRRRHARAPHHGDQARLHGRHRPRQAGRDLLEGLRLYSPDPRRSRRLRGGRAGPGRDRRSRAAGLERSGPGHGRLEPGGARDGPVHARRQSSQPREPARQPRQGPRRRRQRCPSGRAHEDPLRAGPRVRDGLGKRQDQLGVVAGQRPVRGSPAPARRRPDRHRREPGPALSGAARDQSGRAHARADQPRQHEARRAVRRLRRPAQPGPGGGGERAVVREPTRPPWASSRCTISRR